MFTVIKKMDGIAIRKKVCRITITLVWEVNKLILSDKKGSKNMKGQYTKLQK